MKRVFVSGIAAAAFCALAAQGWGQDGMLDASSAVSPEVTVSIKVPPSFLFSGVNHVANGVALRNRCGGTISLRGIPPASTIKSAILYWNYMNGSAVGASTDTEMFNGKRVTGTKVADQPDLCWGTNGDHTYRAVVAPVPPGDYRFTALTCNDSSGSNPSITGSRGPVVWDGASLIVTYRDASTCSDRVAIFDRLAGASNSNAGPHSFSVKMDTGTATPFSGSGLYTQVGADGQTGQSFANSSPSGIGTDEIDTFDNSILTGPGGKYPQSDWDGSNGWPMPQLWDTHTLDVDFNGTSTNTDTTAVTADCIAAVAYVEQQGGF